MIQPDPALVAQNGRLLLEAIGGVGPYNYSVIVGAGSIDASGLYTAPNEPGVAQVQVIDSDAPPSVALLNVTINTPLKLFLEIIRAELALQEGQVYLWDQKIKIPNDQGLYVAVGVVSEKYYSNVNRKEDDGAGGLNQVQTANVKSMLSVDLISRGPAARDRKGELVLAFNSDYSRQIQQAHGFYVAKLPDSFVNLSVLDGAAIPYRFRINVNVHYAISKTKAVQFFDTFADPTVTIDP